MIRGERIALTGDIPSMAMEWRNEKEIWKWCRQYTLITSAQQEAWEKKIATDPTIKMFGIKTQINSLWEGIGVCGLTSIDRVNQNAEFSLYIAPEYQGKGYGQDALKTLLRHGFRDHNLHVIWGETFSGNPALEMFRKVGFEIEGTMRDAYFRDGKFINAIRVSMTREEFRD